MKKRFWVLVSMAVLSVCLMGCGRTYSLNDYYGCEEDGYNGRGHLYPYFDDEEMAKQIANEENLSDEEMFGLIFSLDEALDVDWSKSSDLSNGDVVYIKFNQEPINKFNEEHKKYKLEGTDYSYTVENLKDLKEIDFFEDIEISASGFSSSGDVKVSSKKYPEIRFSVTPQSGVSNGDVINIELSNTNEDYYAEEYEAIPSKTSMTWTVDGLDEYVSSLSQLTDDAKNLVFKDVNDRVIANAQKKNFLNAKHSIEKMILLTSKDDQNKKNRLYVIYSESAEKKRTSKSDPIPFERYNYYKYDNVVLYSDGTVYVDVSDPDAPDYTFGIGTGFEKDGLNIAGYENYEKCYNDVVRSNLDKWIAEESDVETLDSGKSDEDSDLDDIVDSYARFIDGSSEIKENLDYYGVMGFSFCYIDEDDIPELAIQFFAREDSQIDTSKPLRWSDEENADLALTLLTYDGSEVSILGTYSTLDYLISYSPKMNNIIIGGGDGESTQEMRLEIKDGHISFVQGCSIETNQDTYEFEYYRLLSSDWRNDKEPIDEKEYQAENDSLEAEEESMESIGDADYYHTIEDAMNIFKEKNE